MVEKTTNHIKSCSKN